MGAKLTQSVQDDLDFLPHSVYNQATTPRNWQNYGGGMRGVAPWER